MSNTKKTAAKNSPRGEASGGNGENPSNKSEAVSDLPMFYKSVTVLNAAEHGKLKVKPIDNFEFAKTANSIVIAASEAPQAAAHYPVVFGRFGGSLSMFAVTGHTGGENVFVGKDNKWREGAYVPAYVRRYPFLLVQSQDGKTLHLAVDSDSPFCGNSTGTALYQKGEPSDAAKQALNFCARFRNELARTSQMLKNLEAADVLVERSAEVNLNDGKKSMVTGFLVVDEQKLSELGDEKFLTLRKDGLLNIIYSHLWSMRSWDNLLA